MRHRERSKPKECKTTHYRNNLDEIMDCTMELGQLMIRCGAEAQRVEDTMTRILTAYGAVKTEIFAISSMVLATVTWESGEITTQSKRISGYGVDLARLEKLNDLARHLTTWKPAADQFREQLTVIQKPGNKDWISCFFDMLSGFVWCLFFGGDMMDAGVGAVMGLIIFLFEKYLRTQKSNTIIYTLLSCFATGLIGLSLVKLGLGHHEDKVIIVCVMFFIPTLALCNAVKDMLNSDIITGLYRFTEALLITTAMTTGFFFARVFMGDLRDAVPGIQMNAIHFSVQILLAALGTLGFSDFFGIERRRLLQASIGGIIAWSVFLLIDHLNGGLFFCNAGAALVIGFWSEFAARRWKAPSNIFLIPAVIPLLPGALLYRTLNGIITGSASQAYTAGTDLALTVAGIEIGFLTAFVFTYWAIGFFREAAHNISVLSKARRIRKIRRKK